MNDVFILKNMARFRSISVLNIKQQNQAFFKNLIIESNSMKLSIKREGKFKISISTKSFAF